MKRPRVYLPVAAAAERRAAPRPECASAPYRRSTGIRRESRPDPSPVRAAGRPSRTVVRRISVVSAAAEWTPDNRLGPTGTRTGRRPLRAPAHGRAGGRCAALRFWPSARAGCPCSGFAGRPGRRSARCGRAPGRGRCASRFGVIWSNLEKQH